MITLTEEQAQQIEEALLNWKAYVPLGKVALWDESDEQALSTIRAARAQADHIADADKMVAETVKQKPIGDMASAWFKKCCQLQGELNALKRAQPVKQEPVAWHHPECKGECIACLIERCVKDSYGTQGLDFMLRHINAAPVQPVKQEEK